METSRNCLSRVPLTNQMSHLCKAKLNSANYAKCSSVKIMPSHGFCLFLRFCFLYSLWILNLHIQTHTICLALSFSLSLSLFLSVCGLFSKHFTILFSLTRSQCTCYICPFVHLSICPFVHLSICIDVSIQRERVIERKRSRQVLARWSFRQFGKKSDCRD